MGGSVVSRSGWDFLVSRLIDDVRGLLRLLTIVSVCFAVGTAVFGLVHPQERAGATAWALFVVAFAAICAVLWAVVERWRSARTSRPRGGPADR
jgi:hypothetical protein